MSQRLLLSASKVLLLLAWVGIVSVGSVGLLMGAYKEMLLLAWVVDAPAGATADIWTALAADPKGDGRDPSAADAAQLSYRYDKVQDFLWLRMSLYGKPNEDVFGVNIAVDTGAKSAPKMNWWGANKDFKFDKLITAWVTRANNGYQGTIGVGDAAGANAKNFNNLLQNDLEIRVEGDSILIGLKRTDLTDKMNLIAAVGFNQQWNDDIPDTRSVALDLSARRPTRGLREIDMSRNNFRLPSDYRPLANNQPPQVIKKGHGREALILIPGVYSGNEAFDGFIARTQSRYKFYVVTPPGLNGTPAPPLPPETTSAGKRAWHINGMNQAYEPFLEDLLRRAREAKAERVQVHCMDTRDIPRVFQNIELLWSEGAAYNIGFSNAVTAWKPALAPRGLARLHPMSRELTRWPENYAHGAPTFSMVLRTAFIRKGSLWCKTATDSFLLSARTRAAQTNNVPARYLNDLGGEKRLHLREMRSSYRRQSFQTSGAEACRGRSPSIRRYWTSSSSMGMPTAVIPPSAFSCEKGHCSSCQAIVEMACSGKPSPS